MPHLDSIRHLAALGLTISLLASVGCDTSGADDDATCDGAKCDLPGDPDDQLCELRRADAFDPNQRAFTKNFLRWSCSDVAGVTAEDRGQEYCEYFAIAQLPPTRAGGKSPSPVIVGRNLGADWSFGTTKTKLKLSYDQLAALEAADAEVVGQCVFTSWNSDVPGPVPACDDGTCPSVLGVAVDEPTFRMHFEVNSYDAAERLARECIEGTTQLGDRDEELSDDDFTRGCMLNAEINDTAYRKSDSFVCAASMRAAECGCTLESGAALAETLAGPDRRGFPLGTWSSSSELPAGCRYLELGDGSQTVVTCDLTASDVINASLDLKGHCQSKYGGNVVVHVPMPEAAELTCAPASTGSAYTDGCSATPWVIADGAPTQQQ